MNTVLTASPDTAARYIRAGKLSVFPTETVYGLGADATNEAAVRDIFRVKGRPSDNPLIVHVAHRASVGEVARDVPPTAMTLLDAFAPGPLTLVLMRRRDLPDIVTAGLDTVGVRIPSLPVARSFLDACDTPVAAPSANRSGRPSPTTWRAAYTDLAGMVPCILQGERTDAGLESTVVDVITHPPVILRPGAVSVEDIRSFVPNVKLGAGGEGDERARSPGTRHRHYAPDARVVIVDHPREAGAGGTQGYIGVDAPANPEEFSRVYVAGDVRAYAHELFHFLRACDAAGCERVYAQRVDAIGLGRALMDRLERAAER